MKDCHSLSDMTRVIQLRDSLSRTLEDGSKVMIELPVYGVLLTLDSFGPLITTRVLI